MTGTKKPRRGRALMLAAGCVLAAAIVLLNLFTYQFALVRCYVDGMEHARDENLRSNTAYTLRALPAGYERWRSGSAENYSFYPGGMSMTLNGNLTLAAVRYVTATFRYLDGTETTRSVLPGESFTVPGGYWVAGTVSYTGGVTAAIERDTTFTEAEGPR